ncbi:MAG: DUF6519 domain-containing protein [Chloroflexota bacterium]
MKGDFTRDTFDPVQQFSRVLMQQGRVQLDADWNEQIAIFWHYLRSLTTDLVGPHWGPAHDLGFEISPTDGPGFTVGPGRYYVNGLLCENRERVEYVNPSHCIFPGEVVLEAGRSYLVYLDVWERHLTHVEAPPIREVALGGPDTTTRAQIVWQVRPLLLEEERGDGHTETRLRQALEMLLRRLEAAQANRDEAAVRELLQRIAEIRAALQALEDGHAACGARLRALLPPTGAGLQARARQDGKPEDPCTIPPQSRYRGAENQLYRVEIHRAGEADKATVKWSRDNGSVTFPILAVSDQMVSLAHLGRDGRFTLSEGDWVEAIDDDYTLEGRTADLLRVEKVYREEQKVLLSVPLAKVGQDLSRHPFLRRWDQSAYKKDGGTLPVSEGEWLELEDGVQIRFDEGGDYRSGDYWLIPARVATGDVEWPLDTEGRPLARSPHGIAHYYAPLATITFNDEPEVEDCRCVVTPLCAPAAGR